MSTTHLYHRDWHLLAQLKPRLSAQTRTARHVYRGEPTFIIQDQYSGRCHRFSRYAWEIIRRFDGDRDLQSIWQRMVDQKVQPLPRQSDLVDLIDQLIRLELIELEGAERQGVVAGQEARKARWKQVLQKVVMPLSIKLPIWDPDSFLSRNRWLETVLTHPLLLSAYLLIVLVGVVLAVGWWSEFQNNLLDAAVLRENLILLVLTYPFIKAFHELAHAVLVRRWGGHVHEVGLMFLVFFPVPYVDATDASMFVKRYQRMAVGFAGIATELVLASLAMIVWVAAEPGILRAIAANIVIVGGISSLLFNGNPLVRFDAYYVLSDAWEIPNLGRRANDMFGYQLGRALLGWQRDPAQEQMMNVCGRLIGYAITSFAYRMIIVVGISIYLTGILPLFGLLLVGLFVTMGILVPLVKSLRSGWRKSSFHLMKGRFVLALTGSIGLVVLLLGWMPMPSTTNFEALVLPRDESIVRVAETGQLSKPRLTAGTQVSVGQTLISVTNSDLPIRKKVLMARLDRYESQRQGVYGATAELPKLDAVIAATQAEQERIDQRLEQLDVRAAVAGELQWHDGVMQGADYASRGEQIGLIRNDKLIQIRGYVTESVADRLRQSTETVELRSGDGRHTYNQDISLQVLPSAVNELSDIAFTLDGGGQFARDGRDGERIATLRPVVAVVLSVPDFAVRAFKERLYVRVSHPQEPLANHIWRFIETQFLSFLKA